MDQQKEMELVDLLEEAIARGDTKAEQHIRAMFAPAAAAAPDLKHNEATGALSQLTQGLTLGFGDEMSGAMDAVMAKVKGSERGIGDLYREARGQHDAANQDYAQRRPIVSSLMQGTGGAALALPTAGATLPASAARSIPSVVRALGGKGGGLLDSALTGSLIGSAFGAGAGAGNAQPGERLTGAPGERFDGALGGAGMGAAFGASVPVVAQMAAKLRAPGESLGRYVSQVVGRVEPTVPPVAPRTAAPDNALERVLNSMQRDGVDPGMMRVPLANAKAAGDPVGIVDMAGPATQRLGRAAVTLPGPSRNIATSALDKRSDSLHGRVVQDLEAGLGRPISPDAVPAAVAARRNAAAPGYDDVRNFGELDVDGVLGELSQKPTVYGPRHERARAMMMSTDGKAPAPLYDKDGSLARYPTLEDIDLIKRGVHGELYNNKVPGRIEPKNALDAQGQVNLKSNLHGELLPAVDAAVPEYAATRARYAGDTKVIEAAELGNDVLKMSADDLASTIKGFESAAEREMFRGSAVSAIERRLMVAADGAEHANLVRSIFGHGKGAKAQQLRALFDDDIAYAKFQARMQSKLTEARTRNFTLGGSNTADKLHEAQDLKDPLMDAADSVVRQGPFAAGREWLATNTVGRMRAGVGEKGRAEITSELFNFDNAARADAFLKALDDLAAKRRAAGGRVSVAYATGAGAAADQ